MSHRVFDQTGVRSDTRLLPDSSMIRYLVTVRCNGRAFWRTSRYRLFGACIKKILAIVSLKLRLLGTTFRSAAGPGPAPWFYR